MQDSHLLTIERVLQYLQTPAGTVMALTDKLFIEACL